MLRQFHHHQSNYNPDKRFMILDLTDFYYYTLMEEYEYLQLHLSVSSQEIIDKYKLTKISCNRVIYIGHGRVIYIETCNGMPELK